MVIASVSSGFATPQIPDKLIYNADTLSLFLKLPKEFYDSDTLTVNLFEKKTRFSTDCGRGYIANWIIIDNQLYLTNIYSCNYKDQTQADLKQLFRDKYIDGKVKADWITANVFATKGKLLLYVHDANNSIFEQDVELQFQQGQLIEMKSYNNSKTRQSVYAQDGKKFLKAIYSSINWDILPQHNQPVKVVLQFSSNEEGKIDSVIVARGADEIFNQEAIRVVKAIPEWNIYYRRGKHERVFWNVPIIFSEERKQEYKEEN
jgi:hypothetical protein